MAHEEVSFLPISVSDVMYKPRSGYRFAAHEERTNPELAAIWNYAGEISEMVHSEADLPEWAQHKIAAARVHLGDVKEFIEQNIAEQEAQDPEGVRFSGG